MRIIDADGHVAEGPSLAVEAMQRWPEHITPRADGRVLVIEGRNYPEAEGSGGSMPSTEQSPNGQLLHGKGQKT